MANHSFLQVSPLMRYTTMERSTHLRLAPSGPHPPARSAVADVGVGVAWRGIVRAERSRGGPMAQEVLHGIATALVVEGKGILAADESDGTIARRFDSIDVE